MDPLRVCVTGAAGQIAYSLLYSIGNGDVFGKDQVRMFFFSVLSLLLKFSAFNWFLCLGIHEEVVKAESYLVKYFKAALSQA